jgi:hypothetical protein
LKKLPTVPARAPIAMKIAVKPVTNPTAHRRVFRVLRSPPPAKYVIYIGNIGSRQGEIKVIIPSRKATIYCIKFLLIKLLR